MPRAVTPSSAGGRLKWSGSVFEWVPSCRVVSVAQRLIVIALAASPLRPFRQTDSSRGHSGTGPDGRRLTSSWSAVINLRQRERERERERERLDAEDHRAALPTSLRGDVRASTDVLTT